jgi:hypothetical protein
MPWQGRIRDARSRGEVVQVARDFVAQLSPAEVDRLPVECKPRAIETEADLQEYALLLARHHAHGDAARLIVKLSEFFSNAAARLAQLARRDTASNQR